MHNFRILCGETVLLNLHISEFSQIISKIYTFCLISYKFPLFFRKFHFHFYIQNIQKWKKKQKLCKFSDIVDPDIVDPDIVDFGYCGFRILWISDIMDPDIVDFGYCGSGYCGFRILWFRILWISDIVRGNHKFGSKKVILDRYL